MNKTSRKRNFFSGVRQSATITVIFLLVCGLGFPLLLTGISAVFFPNQAQGNLVYADGEAVGSYFVGQDFTEDYFMKCRPSAYNYNTYYEDENGGKYYNDGSEYAGIGSGSDNYAPSNPELAKRVDADIQEFLAANPQVSREDIPADLMTASGSGLDPHISPEAAAIQLPAIAEASGISEERLAEIVSAHTSGKLVGIFGEETVNVLMVNLEIAREMGLIRNIETP